MLTRSQTTTLLQIFSELTLYSQVISKSIKVADDTFQSNSECEWVKEAQGRLYHPVRIVWKDVRPVRTSHLVKGTTAGSVAVSG